MATAALILLAAPVATPVPANDTAVEFIDWTADPRAIRLLASCVSNPPKGEWHETRYVQTRDLTWRYVGYRAAALGVIRDQHGQRALDHYEATGEYEPFRRYCYSVTVVDAIDAAMNDALYASVEG